MKIDDLIEDTTEGRDLLRAMVTIAVFHVLAVALIVWSVWWLLNDSSAWRWAAVLLIVFVVYKTIKVWQTLRFVAKLTGHQLTHRSYPSV